MEKHKMLLEFFRKEETEHGAIWISESVTFMKKIWDMAKKLWFDCYMKGYPKEKLNYKPTGNTYKITTLNQVSDLSPEQFEFFIEDFRNWNNMHREHKALKKVLGNALKFSNTMTWLDTWLNTAEVDIKISNKL